MYALHKLLPENTNFTIEKEIIRNEDCIILNTVLDEFPVEIFGQKIPSTKQNAYRHIIAEYKILKKKERSLNKK